MPYFVGEYSNKQCDYYKVIFLIATSEYWANRYMSDGVEAYGYSYEFNAYLGSITYNLRKISEEEADDIGIEEFINIADYGYSDNYK